MPQTAAQKLIAAHLIKGEMIPGREIQIKIDQTLTQDATGTLVMLELEAMGLERVKTEVSAQYIDHNLIQEDFKNADDHLFLLSACKRFGIWYSRAGNGVSHPVHQERFGVPGKTLLGSDSHTCAAGAIGMLAIGAGGMEVALAMAGEPFSFRMPKIWGVRLAGKLPDWVSAKDVILEMLRRHTVKGGVGKIIEYFGPGLDCLSAMDRHVIANMGAELGATATVFPSDKAVKAFLASQGREKDWKEILPDKGANYDLEEEIDLSKLEPLIAMPSSPDKVVPVREVVGQEIGQAYIGSSANPGYRDFAIAAQIVKGKTAHPSVSFDINPSSRQILENLVRDGHLVDLLRSGARIHQAGCNGCIGMGQAPATDTISLRTVPRNFPGRSGTEEDKVCLVSPETAAASALTGVITDPRTLEMQYPKIAEPKKYQSASELMVPPLPLKEAKKIGLEKGPNISEIPDLDPFPDVLKIPVLLKCGDNVSTDEILPAGARVLPFRSNIEKISEFSFERIDKTYYERARKLGSEKGHAVIGGENYGQGSSREHAAIAPRYLGLRVVIAKSFARIHWQNLCNFGILPLTFQNPKDYDDLKQGDELEFGNLPVILSKQSEVTAKNDAKKKSFSFKHELSPQQVKALIEGGLINWMKRRLKK